MAEIGNVDALIAPLRAANTARPPSGARAVTSLIIGLLGAKQSSNRKVAFG